jgi:hypothetical protein
MTYTDVEKLAALRVNKKELNTDVKPVDLLRAAVYALETGEETFTSAVIMTRETRKDGSVLTGAWRSGVTREQELCMYVYAQHELIEKMRRGL